MTLKENRHSFKEIEIEINDKNIYISVRIGSRRKNFNFINCI